MKWTDLNIGAIEYFLDSIDLNSLTLAAEKNNVSRPAVSMAIKRLEDILGESLILHSKNKLEITEGGRTFYRRAKAAVGLFNQAFSEDARQTSRIACSATLAEFVVLPLLHKMKFDLIDIEVQIGTTSQVRHWIGESSANLGFIIDDGRTYGLNSIPLHKGRFVLRSRTGKMVEPLITTEPRPEVFNLLKKLKEHNKLPSNHVKIASWAVCKKAADILGGSCLVPDIIPMGHQKNIHGLKFDDQYLVKALFRDSNRLTTAEYQLLSEMTKGLKSKV